jgi:GNAT superfamily N-acetyltransferase
MSAAEPVSPSRHVLDNPALASLTGPHAHFAERRGRVLRYPVDVSPWLALPDEPDADDWADLAALAGPGAEVPLPGFRGEVPAGWEITLRAGLAVAHGIHARGETPFLHTSAANTHAIRLYESLGFRLRRRTAFLAARVPEREVAPVA